MIDNNRALLYFNPADGRDELSPVLRAQGWDVHPVTDTEGALQAMRHCTFRVGLAQWDQAEEGPIRDRMEELLDTSSQLHWVALLSQATQSLRDLGQVLRNYFYDYHTLPLDIDRLLVTLGHAYGMAEVGARVDAHEEQDLGRYEIIGRSRVMQGLFRAIHKVAATDLTVLIGGESGTGKELTALAVHRLSSRFHAPFVAVNCGALPANLIQAELFGHERGAFTGAERRRIGRIEAAQGGTIFLDEIGDLPLDLQVNLLRFLQEKTIERVGGSLPMPVDVRVIAATNVDLERAVSEGRFREDLYYRLNVLHLDVPSLRDRPEDIEILATFFFDKFAKGKRPNLRGFSDQALRVMEGYSWPGNVRELINRIQRAVVMCEGRLIKPVDLGLERRSAHGHLTTLAEARAAAERETIVATLRSTRNNVSRAAEGLGISRVTLYRLMEKYSIDWQGT